MRAFAARGALLFGFAAMGGCVAVTGLADYAIAPPSTEGDGGSSLVDRRDDGAVADADSVMEADLPKPECAPAPANARAWWTGDGTVLDELGGNELGPKASARYAAGKVGEAFQLDGAAPLATSSVPAIPVLAQLSVEAWISLADERDERIVDRVTAGEPDGWLFDILKPRRLRLVIAGRDLTSPSGDVALGRFVHVAATYDGAKLRLFIDGQERVSTDHAGPVPAANQPIRIGGSSDGRNRFAGSIDEVVIYSRAITPAEIAASARGLPRCR